MIPHIFNTTVLLFHGQPNQGCFVQSRLRRTPHVDPALFVNFPQSLDNAVVAFPHLRKCSEGWYRTGKSHPFLMTASYVIFISLADKGGNTCVPRASGGPANTVTSIRPVARFRGKQVFMWEIDEPYCKCVVSVIYSNNYVRHQALLVASVKWKEDILQISLVRYSRRESVEMTNYSTSSRIVRFYLFYGHWSFTWSASSIGRAGTSLDDQLRVNNDLVSNASRDPHTQQWQGNHAQEYWIIKNWLRCLRGD